MNKEYLKEKIAFYKLLLTFLVTMGAGSTAWIFNNFGKAPLSKIIFADLALSVLCLLIGFFLARIKKLLKNLLGE